jgi:hypothetical protein
MCEPPFVYDGLNRAPEPKSTIAEASEAVKSTVRRIGDAIDKGRKAWHAAEHLEQRSARSLSDRFWSHSC